MNRSTLTCVTFLPITNLNMDYAEREMNFLSIYKKTTTTKFLHYSLQELVKLTSEDFNTSLDQPHRPCYRSVFPVRLGHLEYLYADCQGVVFTSPLVIRPEEYRLIQICTESLLRTQQQIYSSLYLQFLKIDYSILIKIKRLEL